MVFNTVKVKSMTFKIFCLLVISLKIFILGIYLSLPHQSRKVKYLNFDQVLDQNLQLKGLLPEILPRHNSIFFVETSGKIGFELKSLCVIESAAKYHQDQNIYVLMTSPMIQDPNMAQLQSTYKNINIKYINVQSFIKGSPLENLWDQEAIQNSDFRESHLSDILRFLILYNFGGTYLDLDALILKTLPMDIPNFVGRESWTHPYLGKKLKKIYFYDKYN